MYIAVRWNYIITVKKQPNSACFAIWLVALLLGLKAVDLLG